MILVCVCVCVCVFIKLHITTAQSGPVILVILCHSHWSSQGGINDTCYENLWSNATKGVCVCVCVCVCCHPIIICTGRQPCCGRTSRGHTVSTIFSLSMEMSRLTRDGTPETVSRDRIHFPCSGADHEQDWQQPYPLDQYSCYNMCDHTGGRSHRISPPSSWGACLNFYREEDSAAPFPRRPRRRILCTHELIVLHLLGTRYVFFIFCEEKSQFVWLHRDLNSRPNVRRFRGYQLNHRGDRSAWMIEKTQPELLILQSTTTFFLYS